MNLSKDHQELLSALNASDAKYILVGGYAVIAHTEPRATKDLDVFICNDEDNAVRVFQALASFGAPLAGLSPADFSDGVSYFQMGQPPHRIDILQSISGVTFDEIWVTRAVARVNDLFDVPIISIEMLIQNKRAAGRLRDLADVEALEEALEVTRSKRSPQGT